MKDIVKNLNVKSYFFLAAVVVTLVGFIIAIVSNGVAGYGIENFALVVLFTILALIFTVATVYLQTKQNNFVANILVVATIALLVTSAVIIISSRAELIGTLWVTALDSVNPLANQAMNTGFPAFVIYLVSSIVLVVSGFLKD